jgi:hypothetical protein
LCWSIFDILRSAMLSEQRVSLSRLVFDHGIVFDKDYH